MGLVTGAVGYTRASYLGEVITAYEDMEEDDVRWNLVETALSYNGAAWRTGGRSPLGMDAVGLVCMSYLINGVVLQRQMALPQSGPLYAIDEKNMQSGDVIYFSNSMGMYIGEHRFIHATMQPGSEGVVVSSLRPKDEDYVPQLASQMVAIASLF